MTTGIYVCEEDDRVGPFASREDADCFIALIELLSGSREGIQRVEIAEEAEAQANPRPPFCRYPVETAGNQELQAVTNE